jgi:hypothetical protein
LRNLRSRFGSRHTGQRGVWRGWLVLDLLGKAEERGLVLLAGEQICDAVVLLGHEADRTLLPEGWLAVSAAPHGVDRERRSFGPEIEYLGERPVAEAQELGAHEFEALRLKIRKLHRRSAGLHKLESHEIEIALVFQVARERSA